jgi:Uma2 family endonuclease
MPTIHGETNPNATFPHECAAARLRIMVPVTPAEVRYTAERYFALVDEGALHPDDRVELLEGVVVGMAPQAPRHASATRRADRTLRDAIGRRAVVSVQAPLVVGPYSVPEPDVAVVPGHEADYDDAHPTTALLVVEVADSSLIQDRLTKAAIYAAANIPEYWIVNLRDDRVEVFRSPDPAGRRYREIGAAGRDERIDLAALPGATVAVGDLLPGG